MVIFITTLHTQDTDVFTTHELVMSKEKMIYMYVLRKKNIIGAFISKQYDGVFSSVCILSPACINNISTLRPLKETKGSGDLEGKVK